MTPKQRLKAFEKAMRETRGALEDAAAVLKQRAGTGDEVDASIAVVLGEVNTTFASVQDLLRDLAGEEERAEISATLATIAQALAKRAAPDATPLVKAVQQLRLQAPEVRVQVEPTPVQVNVAPAPVTVHVQPAKDIAQEWEIRVPGLYGAPDRVMTIRKKPAKEQ